MQYVKTLGNLGKGFITSQHWLETLIDEVWEQFRLRYVMRGVFQVTLEESEASILFSIGIQPIPEVKSQEPFIIEKRYTLRSLRELLKFDPSAVVSEIADDLARRVCLTIQLRE